jgi:hypothetical protein
MGEFNFGPYCSNVKPILLEVQIKLYPVSYMWVIKFKDNIKMKLIKIYTFYLKHMVFQNC